MHTIPQYKNWGDKINGFPYTYAADTKGDNWLKKAAADKSEDLVFNVVLRDANKKRIAAEPVTYTVYYAKDYYSLPIYCPLVKNNDSYMKISDVSVTDADTEKLFIEVEQTSGTKISIMPAPADVYPVAKAEALLKSGDYTVNSTIKVGGFANGQHSFNPKKSIALDLSEVCISRKKYRSGSFDTYRNFGLGEKIRSVILPTDIKKLQTIWRYSNSNIGFSHMIDLIVPIGVQSVDTGYLSSITIPTTATYISITMVQKSSGKQ